MRFLAPFRAAAFVVAATQIANPVAAQDKGLAPPTRLWAAQTDATTITLVWQVVADAVQYRVFGPKSQKGDAGAAIQQLATLVGRNATRYVALVVSPGLRHQFSVQAVDAKGNVSDKVEFNAVIPQPKQAISTVPPPPSSVTASETGSGEIRLAWSAVPHATGYLIGRSVAPGGLKTLCQLCPTETNYVDTAVTPGAKHIYAVTAITPFGTSQKTRSNEVTPTTGKGAGHIETGDTDGPPKGVSNLKVTLKSPTSAEVTWGGGVGATAFHVYRRLGTGKEELIATLGGTVTSFLDTFAGGFGGGVSYEIQAVNAKGSSDKATVTLAAGPPKAVTNPKATLKSPTSAEVTWGGGVGATAFQIYRRMGTGKEELIATLGGTVTSFLDTFAGGFGGGVSYEIQAVNAKGSSDKATVTLAAGPPKAVTNPKATLKSPTSVEVTWEGGVGVTAFQIYRRMGTGKEELIATLGGTVTSFLDTFAGGFRGSVSYGIQAVNAKGSSEKATVAIASEKAAADSAISTPPKGPSGLKATVVSPTLVRLTWSPGLVGATYRVMRQAKGATQVIATLPGSVSNFLDHFPPGAVPGMIGYWIEAVDGKGTSEKITVTMDPAKNERALDSLPRPKERVP